MKFSVAPRAIALTVLFALLGLALVAGIGPADNTVAGVIKTTVCHKDGQSELSLPDEAVSKHIGPHPGDYLGPCQSSEPTVPITPESTVPPTTPVTPEPTATIPVTVTVPATIPVIVTVTVPV